MTKVIPKAHVKTAVSIEEPVYKRAETKARKLGISRSRLYSLALEEYLAREDNRDMMERLNRVHAEEDPEEKVILSAIRTHHRRLLKGQWK